MSSENTTLYGAENDGSVGVCTGTAWQFKVLKKIRAEGDLL
jgi:hypothetical protein